MHEDADERGGQDRQQEGYRAPRQGAGLRALLQRHRRRGCRGKNIFIFFRGQNISPFPAMENHFTPLFHDFLRDRKKMLLLRYAFLHYIFSPELVFPYFFSL